MSMSSLIAEISQRGFKDCMDLCNDKMINWVENGRGGSISFVSVL